MEMLTSLKEIFFRKQLNVEVTEEISALTRAEYENYLREKNSE